MIPRAFSILGGEVSGGNSKQIAVKQPFPKRNKAEWREITRLKLRQYESIGFEILGRRKVKGAGE